MQENPSIWLIDDNPEVLEIIRLAFEKEQLSCQLESFADTKDLLTAMRQTPRLPTLLLVDYYLPDMNGLELVERLASNPPTQSLKIVLFSQQMNRAIAEKADDLQVYQIASKPFTFQDWRTFARELCLAGHFP